MKASRILHLALPLALAFAGCTGTVGEPPSPNERVASLVFVADQMGALVAQKCPEALDCRLPNDNLCQQLTVDVYGDGHTVGTCYMKDGSSRRIVGAREGVPLRCRSHTDRYAVHCIDVNDNVAVDGYDGSVAVYPTRAPSWYQPAVGNHSLGPGAGYLTEDEGSQQPPNDQQPPDNQVTPPDQTPQQPQQGSGNPQLDAECRKKAVNAFNQAFQVVIQQEGLNGIHYQPPGQVPNTSGFYADGSYNSNAAQNCQVTRPGCKKKNHWSQWLGGSMQWYGGGCYCSVTNYGVSCYTSLMISAAKAQSCNVKPPECDANVWGAAVQDATVPAKQFVDQNNKNTDTKAGVAAGIQAGIGLLNILGSIGSFGGTNNYCSPLVLDLAGDGIALTSAAGGVSFDLNASGAASRTAWVRGADDALLALDRDGNGRIDSGAELFGDASGGSDGFAALAALDRADHGGNGNGLVESGDLLYDQLLLWRDANRDGVSQAAELSSLPAAGVSALGIRAESDRSCFDEHGNDLSAQGSFLRADGSRGQLVDVFFRN